MRANRIIYSILSMAVAVVAASSSLADSAPSLNHGKKWRIGYYEGGPYSDYAETMRTLIGGLITLGWIQDKQPPPHPDEMRMPYLEWLRQCHTPYLAFRKEDSYSADWDENKRGMIREALLQKCKSGELDLIIAMGTWAGLDLANNDHAVPVLVLSTSDPVAAGIVQSMEDSGYGHVTARVDPTRYVRQIRMFHRIVGFRSLGVAYENTKEGRIYSAISQIRHIARERGFQVITCEVIDTTTDTQKSNQSCLECYQQLSQKADAIYVTALTCVDRQISSIVDMFRAAGVPSFSMLGSTLVQKGIMLSISSDSGYAALGNYNASKFGEILNGTSPRLLIQKFEDPLDIAVNLKTVKQIGFTMPKGILHIASEIFEK